jgi:hypothetical protein
MDKDTLVHEACACKELCAEDVDTFFFFSFFLVLAGGTCT